MHVLAESGGEAHVQSVNLLLGNMCAETGKMFVCKNDLIRNKHCYTTRQVTLDKVAGVPQSRTVLCRAAI